MEFVPCATIKSADPILIAYLVCAEWADLSEEDRDLVTAARSPRWSPMSEADAARDIEAFRKRVGEKYMDALCGILGGAAVGHDIWLTRQHHGAGFWDRNLPKSLDEAATNAAHALGEAYVEYDADSSMLGIIR